MQPAGVAENWKPRVLIADGDRDSRGAVMWCLLSQGFSVEPVSNAYDAMAALEGALPDLAIIDLGLQGISGRQLIEALRRSPRFDPLRIIATAAMDPFAPLPARVSFLRKPCDLDTLLESIRAMDPSTRAWERR